MIQQSHSWIISEENSNSKRYMHPECSQQHYLQQPRHRDNKCPSTEEWIKNLIYTHMHRTQSVTQPQKNEIIPCAATWMDLEIIIPKEVNQTEKDKNHMIPL